MATEPILVIDADLNKRIATELKRRGRQAVALSELHLRHVKDPELLRALAAHFGDKPWILVTGDDNMPAVHADVIHEVGATLATVDPRWPPGYRGDEDAWGRGGGPSVGAPDREAVSGKCPPVLVRRWSELDPSEALTLRTLGRAATDSRRAACRRGTTTSG